MVISCNSSEFVQKDVTILQYFQSITLITYRPKQVVRKMEMKINLKELTQKEKVSTLSHSFSYKKLKVKLQLPVLPSAFPQTMSTLCFNCPNFLSLSLGHIPSSAFDTELDEGSQMPRCSHVRRSNITPPILGQITSPGSSCWCINSIFASIGSLSRLSYPLFPCYPLRFVLRHPFPSSLIGNLLMMILILPF